MQDQTGRMNGGGRREARARLTPKDRQRVAAVAAKIGWTGLALTVWLLAAETDGWPLEEALHDIILANAAAANPGFDPTIRHHPQVGACQVCWMPAGMVGADDVVIPPVPGRRYHTIISEHPDRRARRNVIDIPPAGS